APLRSNRFGTCGIKASYSPDCSCPTLVGASGFASGRPRRFVITSRSQAGATPARHNSAATPRPHWPAESNPVLEEPIVLDRNHVLNTKQRSELEWQGWHRQ